MAAKSLAALLLWALFAILQAVAAVADDPLTPLRNLGIDVGNSVMKGRDLDNVTLAKDTATMSDSAFSKQLVVVSAVAWGIAGFIALCFAIFAVGRLFGTFGGNDPSEEGYSKKSIWALRILFVLNALMISVGIIIAFYATSKITRETDPINNAHNAQNASVYEVPISLLNNIVNDNTQFLAELKTSAIGTRAVPSSAYTTMLAVVAPVDAKTLINTTYPVLMSGIRDLYNNKTILDKLTAASPNTSALVSSIDSGDLNLNGSYFTALNNLNTALSGLDLSAISAFSSVVSQVDSAIDLINIFNAFDGEFNNAKQGQKTAFDASVGAASQVFNTTSAACSAAAPAKVRELAQALSTQDDPLKNVISWIDKMNQSASIANYVITGFSIIVVLGTALGFFFDRHEVMYMVTGLLVVFSIAFFVLVGFWMPVAFTASAACNSPVLFLREGPCTQASFATGGLQSGLGLDACAPSTLNISQTSLHQNLTALAPGFSMAAFQNSTSYKNLVAFRDLVFNANLKDTFTTIATSLDTIRAGTLFTNNSNGDLDARLVALKNSLADNYAVYSIDANNIITSKAAYITIIANIDAYLAAMRTNFTSNFNTAVDTNLGNVFTDGYKHFANFTKAADTCDPNSAVNADATLYNTVCDSYLTGVESVWLIFGYLGVFLIPAAIICILGHKRLGQGRRSDDDMYMESMEKYDPFASRTAF